MHAVPPTPSAAPRRFVVYGDDPLAMRLIDELVFRYAAEVTAVLPSAERNYGPQISLIPGIRVVEATRLNTDALLAAGITEADALALVKQDDVGNIDAALTAQELNPDLRLIIRMFNMSLGHGIRRLFNNCAVLSDASMAAPAFVAAALGEVEPSHFRLPGRTLFVARRAEVPARQVLCGLATIDQTGSDDTTASQNLLPPDLDRAELVLATTDTATQDGVGGYGDTRRNRVRRRARLHLAGVLAAVRALINRKLWLAAAALVVVLVAGTVALAIREDDLTPWTAAYLTLLTAVGGANPDVRLSLYQQVLQTVVTLAGVALVPVITAAVVEAVVNARLAIALGRLRQPFTGHIVVIGLGNVGTRVIRQLHELGYAVVAIDRAENARGAELAQQLGIPLIVGDASREETLRAASVQTCRALVVLSTDDVTNLEAALNGRTLNRDLRVVLRLFDGDFAARVQQAFGITISRSVSYVAAPSFAAAMMDRDVLATVPIGRRVLLIAEVSVGPGADLDGVTVASVNAPGKVSVIALHAHLEPRPRWKPPGQQVISARDRLVVVATRAGLAETVDRSSNPPQPTLPQSTAPGDPAMTPLVPYPRPAGA